MNIQGSLFKYIPPERIDVLQGLKVRFTQPSALNDPYECTLTFGTGEFREHLMRSGEGLTGESRARWERTVDLMVTKERLQQYLEKLQWTADRVRKHLDEKVGVLSLSKNALNPRMWSLYAGDHRGLCVGFRIATNLVAPTRRADCLQWSMPVVYADRPHELPDALDSDQLLRLALERKSSAWTDEEEVRIVRSLEHGPVTPIGNDRVGFPVYLFPFSADEISCVVLGARCSIESRQAIRSAMEQHGIEAPLMQVAVVPGTYRLELCVASA